MPVVSCVSSIFLFEFHGVNQEIEQLQSQQTDFSTPWNIVFLKYHMNIFKLTIGNKSLYEISNDNGISAISYLKISVKNIMYNYRKIHKYIWKSSDGKPHSQIDHILIHRRRYSSVLDVRSFRTADCDTDHYQVMAKLTKILAVKNKD
jgi:hypothetical protein